MFTQDRPARNETAFPAYFLQKLALLLFTALTSCTLSQANTDIDHLDTDNSSTLGPEHLAVIINDSDPLSRRIGEYYVKKRNIPTGNIIHVRFKPGNKVMRPQIFKPLKIRVDEQASPSIQAYVLTWTVPYAVGCMSITTAFAAGFHEDFCALGCKPTKVSPYFNTSSKRPYTDFGWRPTIMLAGVGFESVEKLIDRGIAADSTHPDGTAYLLSTTDKARNVRARYYRGIHFFQKDRFKLRTIRSNKLKYRTDIMFYFTGLMRVKGINSNKYLPGAIADHLTSSGGMLKGSSQMNSLDWLEAGATGSYGATSEPCAFVQKFPRPDIVINRYLNGETLLEAYWKSVKWPGQGVFIGEPLAAPFRTRLH